MYLWQRYEASNDNAVIYARYPWDYISGGEYRLGNYYEEIKIR